MRERVMSKCVGKNVEKWRRDLILTTVLAFERSD
jgi:hypothetical protein